MEGIDNTRTGTFDILFYQNPQPLIIYDVETLQILEVNPGALAYYGYTKEEFVLLNVGDLRTPDDFGQFTKLMPSIKEHNPIRVEAKHRLKDGRIRNIEIVSYILNYKDRLCRLAQVHDVTEKVRQAHNFKVLLSVSQSLSETLDLEQILQKVTDTTTEVSNAEFGGFFYNSYNEKGAIKFYTISGASKDAFEPSMVPKNTALFHPTFAEAQVLRFDDISKTPLLGNESLNPGIGNGNLTVTSYLSVPIKSKSGEIHGCLIFTHSKARAFTQESEDLVLGIAAQAAFAIDNAKLFNEVKELNLKKDDFLSVASHELKTPLTSIKASLQIINRIHSQDASSPQVPKLLHTTNVSVGKLSNLIQDLLDVSKIQGGQLYLKKERFKLSRLIEDCCNHVRISGTHELVMEGDFDLEVFADPRQIDQVLVNLVNNAVKYSPRSNEIRLKIEAIDGMAKVSVTDTGIGIPPEKLPYIFDRFYRVDAEGNQFSGLGLGLYISSEVIKRHKGKIGVESKQGKGSTFWFILPVEIKEQRVTG